MGDYTQDNRKRYRLDNAANVYPAVKSRKHPGLFRVSATLKESVQPELLQLALQRTLKRIPSFSVRLRSGLFFHYFSHSDDTLFIQEDVINPCMYLVSDRNQGFQIRVRYYDRRIALEVFHSVSDGSGAMVFLKTLVAQYLMLRGIYIPPTDGVLDCEESPRPEEAADDFHAFAGECPPRPRREQRAYHVSGTKLPYDDLTIVTGTLPAEAVKGESKRHGVSITEFLISVYVHILSHVQAQECRAHPLPIKIQVPVNLRQFYNSDTLRNYASYVCPGIDPAYGAYTFEEIISTVHHLMRYEVTAKQLRSRVAANTRAERHPLLRVVPLFAKNYAINLVYKRTGPGVYTSALSNLGMIKVPRAMQPHVEVFDFNLGPSHATNVDCAVLGYRDQLRINFTRVIEEAFVERAFFTFLVQQGIPVSVESNKDEMLCPTV